MGVRTSRRLFPSEKQATLNQYSVTFCPLCLPARAVKLGFGLSFQLALLRDLPSSLAAAEVDVVALDVRNAHHSLPESRGYLREDLKHTWLCVFRVDQEWGGRMDTKTGYHVSGVRSRLHG